MIIIVFVNRNNWLYRNKEKTNVVFRKNKPDFSTQKHNQHEVHNPTIDYQRPWV